MKDNWLKHWEQGNIPFHLEKVNPLLEKYWPQLDVSPKANVLVPLCGESNDLLWLAKKDLHIIGVELSSIACEAFFIENELKFKVETIGNFTRYYNNQIELLCGDFFTLSKEMLPTITAVYDRAALIALPPDLRQHYALHLTQLMDTPSQMLLITCYSKDDVEGPPYSVSFHEITQLFGKQFQIAELERIHHAAVSTHLSLKGYNEVYDEIYKLTSIV